LELWSFRRDFICGNFLGFREIDSDFRIFLEKVRILVWIVWGFRIFNGNFWIGFDFVAWWNGEVRERAWLVGVGFDWVCLEHV
jgi:hypothetical protein